MNCVGLVIDWDFHLANKWVSALTAQLVQALVAEFRPLIITRQEEYARWKDDLVAVISMEPGWAAPKLAYDWPRRHPVAVFVSDPHSKTGWMEDYFRENHLDWILSYYFHPFFRHFPDFPKEKFVHVPWAIPDAWISEDEPMIKGSGVAIFGGKQGDSYDVRNWCRAQPGVRAFDNSGVENKTMTDEQYIRWLRQFDAIVAAGSSDPRFDLVTPKYFEIASAGALLIGQSCRDLEVLGFDETNMVAFQPETFTEVLREYRAAPERYRSIRERGRRLIAQRHKVSDRVRQIRSLLLRAQVGAPVRV